jgi:predicted transcriptional regulator of viral defense system
MTFEDLLEVVGKLPVFHASLLQVGDISPPQLRVQLSRWVRSGKLIQLRRGVYSLAQPYRQVEPHRFAVAQALRKNSYVSLQSALAYHGLIPDHVAAVTCVTTGRTEELSTEVGSFIFRHIAPGYFFGYQQTTVRPEQHAFVATAEKAILDLLYLTPGAEQAAYVHELRLQNLEALSMDALETAVSRMGKPKLARALLVLGDLVARQRTELT